MKNTGDGMLVEFPRVVDAVFFCSVVAGDARFLPRFLLLLGELAMCLGEACEVVPGLASVVDSTGPADSRRSPGSCEPPPASRGRGEIKIELRRSASFQLGSVYDRFTEGFDTADLRQARSLLEHLR